MNKVVLFVFAFLASGPLRVLAQSDPGTSEQSPRDAAFGDLFIDPESGKVVTLDGLYDRWRLRLNVKVRDRETGRWKTAINISDPSSPKPVYVDPFTKIRIDDWKKFASEHDLQFYVDGWWFFRKRVRRVQDTPLTRFRYKVLDGSGLSIFDLAAEYPTRIKSLSSDALPVVLYNDPRWTEGESTAEVMRITSGPADNEILAIERWNGRNAGKPMPVDMLMPKRSFLGRAMSWLARLPIVGKVLRREERARDGVDQQMQRLNDGAKPGRRPPAK